MHQNPDYLGFNRGDLSLCNTAVERIQIAEVVSSANVFCVSFISCGNVFCMSLL